MFAELQESACGRARPAVSRKPREQMRNHPEKKTKSVVFGECINDIPIHRWIGYAGGAPGGL